MDVSRSGAGLLASVLIAATAVAAAPAQAQSEIRLKHRVLKVIGTNRSDIITVTTYAGFFTVQINNKRVVIRRPTLRKIRVDGRAGDDTIRLIRSGGLTPPATVSGGAGNDVLGGYVADPHQLPRPSTSSRATSGWTSSDPSVLLDGGDGDDLLVGADRMFGGAGNDRLLDLWLGTQTLTFDAGPGDDYVAGAPETSGDLGDGNDTYYGYRSDCRCGVDNIGDSSSVVAGGAGNDTLQAGDGAMTFDAGPGDDVVTGGYRLATGTLGDGNDNYAGSIGASTVQGGAGNDQFASSGAEAEFEGDTGADVFVAGRTYDGHKRVVGHQTVSDFGTDADLVHLEDGLSVHSGAGTPTVTVWDGTVDVGTVTAANGHPWTAADFS